MPRAALPLLALALAGCTRVVGTDFGPCAEPPPGAYTFGEVGIGTCLSGPTDLRFVERDGRTILLVANADPYYNHRSGSLLAIDFDALDMSIPENRVDLVAGGAADAPRYLGQIGLVEDRIDRTDLALVPSRFSADAFTPESDDDVRVFDLTDPLDPRPWAGGAAVQVQDDPFHVITTPGRAWVTNLTARTVSVVDTEDTPLRLVDRDDTGEVGADRFVDVDDSGSTALLASVRIPDPRRLPDDDWSLTWAEASFRTWWASDDGLSRWQVGTGSVVPAPDGADVTRDQLGAVPRTPYAYLADVGGAQVPRLAFSLDGDLRTATNTGLIRDWVLDDQVLLRGSVGGGFDAWVEGPALFEIDADRLGLAYVGRTDADAPGVIAVATASDGVTWERQPAPVLEPADAGALSLEDPFVRVDRWLGGWRMWMSVRTEEGWTVGESRAGALDDWAPVATATGLPPDTAAPVVTWRDGRYLGWFATFEGSAWHLARATSVDGLHWEGVEVLAPVPGAVDPTDPPRPGVLASVDAGFRVASLDQGRLSGFARDGRDFVVPDAGGLAFRVASGHVLDGGTVDPDLGANGITPGAVVVLDGVRHLLGTLLGADGRRRLTLLREDGDGWAVRRTSLIDLEQAGLDEAHDPVMAEVDGTWTLWFATPGGAGRTVIRRATSADGLDFTLDPTPWDPDLDWARAGVLPGSLQPLEDGALRLWFTALDRERTRIGAARSTDGGRTFTLEPGPDDPWRIGAGQPGDLDDSGVADPRWFQTDEGTFLAYAASDGARRTLGLARLDSDEADAAGPWERHRGLTGERAPWLPPVPDTFAGAQVHHPVVEVEADDGGLRVWFAGEGVEPGGTPRLGEATGDAVGLFPAVRHPTPGDTLTFPTFAGGAATAGIPLAQDVQAFTTEGAEVTSLRWDPDRGFGWLTFRGANQVMVLDLRDDSRPGDPDTNYRDIEAVLQIRSQNGGFGLRDVVPVPGSPFLYATGRRPEAVLVLDGRQVPDDGQKDLVEDAVLQALPLRTAANDAGAESFGSLRGEAIAGAGMAVRVRDGRRHLFVAQFRDNSLTVFDLDRGIYGEEVGYIPDLGENPHVVRVSPDGRYAVVANYLGRVEDGVVSSTLAVVDADPDSPTFLELLTTVVNR